MKLNTNQAYGIADAFTHIPASDLYGISTILQQVRYGNSFTHISSDYELESLYQYPLHARLVGVPPLSALLLQELYNLSYERLASNLRRDSDAAYMKKGEKLCYGYVATLLTDADGLIEHVALSPANASEQKGFVAKVAEHVPAGKRIVYDKGADSKANRAACAKLGLKEGIIRKKPKGKAYNPWEKRRNKLISKVRFVAERTFGTLKRTYGLSRAKLVGLKKVVSEVWAKSIAYNLKRASNRLAPGLSYA